MSPSTEETGDDGTRTVAPVFSVRMQAATSSQIQESRMEADSHADTTVVGRNALIIHDYGRPVRVSGYDPKDGTKEYRTVSAALAYEHPQTGQVYMLVIHQASEVPYLDNHLLCLMQCRMNGVKIKDLPKFLAS